MRRILLCFFALLPLLAAAQTFPSRPIRILCPFPPGGGVDITARAIANELSKQLGQPITVENRPGAGGNIAAGEVAKAAPDGYTLFITLNALHAISPLVYSKLPFDAIKDFSFITPLVSFDNVLVVSPNAPKSVQELIAQAKAQPGKLTFASSGNGTNTHLIGELFKTKAGIDIVHVPYKGSAPALTDLLGGNVTMMFDTIPSAIAQVKSGKLRAIGVTGAQRSPSLPEIPTIAESGLAGYEAGAWYGLIGPAAMPKELVAKLNAETVKGANGKEFRERMEPLGFSVFTGSPEKMLELIQADAARWAPVVKASGARAD
jgi:tripartite-type tricarboxylate transporter receptor subunit TctC